MTPLELQVYVFALMLLTGMALGCLFDIYRVIRGFFRPRRWLGDVGDLLVWVLAAPLILAGVLLASWGELRVYIFLGLALGAGLYFFLGGAWVRFALRWSLLITGSGIRRGGRLLVRVVSPVAKRISTLAGRVRLLAGHLVSRLRPRAGRVRRLLRGLARFRRR